jgi:AcrR family transcriptional regulator
MPKRIDVAGRELLVSAALKLFAAYGIDAVSIRAVNREAGLGPASVHYHFGTKEALLEAVLELHADMVAEQIRRGARDITAAAGTATARDLVAMLASPYQDLMDEQTDGISWVQLVGRIVQSDPKWILDRSSTQAMRNAASSVYPNASRHDIDRAVTLCVGLLVPQLVNMQRDRRRIKDYELLVDFLTGGLDATLGVGRGHSGRLSSA